MPPVKKVRKVVKKKRATAVATGVAPRRARGGRPSLLTPLIALALAGVIVWAVLSVGNKSSGIQVSERTVTATKGVVQSVVSGSGNLEPGNQYDLNFGTSGEI